MRKVSTGPEQPKNFRRVIREKPRLAGDCHLQRAGVSVFSLPRARGSYGSLPPWRDGAGWGRPSGLLPSGVDLIRLAVGWKPGSEGDGAAVVVRALGALVSSCGVAWTTVPGSRGYPITPPA